MPRPLRLMTWNVRSLRDDREAVIRVLEKAAPDVLFVQEAPRFLRAQSKLAALARQAGLVVAADNQQFLAWCCVPSRRIAVHAAIAHVHAVYKAVA